MDNQIVDSNPYSALAFVEDCVVVCKKSFSILYFFLFWLLSFRFTRNNRIRRKLITNKLKTLVLVALC